MHAEPKHQKKMGRGVSAQDMLYEEILTEAERIWKAAEKLEKPSIDDASLKRGLQVSAQASAQLPEVPITPKMKNALKQFGDITDEHPRLLCGDPVTEAEKVIYNRTVELATKLNGPRTLEYNTELPADAPEHYNVDVWNNLKELGKWRDIQPGQMEERKATLEAYKQKPEVDWLFTRLRTDPLLKKAVLYTLDLMPSVTPFNSIDEIAAPFQKKHSNVGYLSAEYVGWGNDRSTEPKSGLTFGVLAIKLAKLLTHSSLARDNISTVFGRNQRGKGRLLIALCRKLNLYLDRLEAAEIEKNKNFNPYFTGYNNDKVLKKALKSMATDANKMGACLSNFDQAKYDMHINPVWLALIGAMRERKTNGALGKSLAFDRAVLNIHTWVVNGLSGDFVEIWGRMFSGFIDTNQGDGWVGIIINTYCLMSMDPKYMRKILSMKVPGMVMGDDSLVIYWKDFFSKKGWVDEMASLGFEVNVAPGKYEFGAFFLQNRYFRKDGKDIMVYPWTRVVRSMLFKESGKALGPYGWLAADLQQLSKLIEYPPALDAAVEIILPYDKLRLGYGLTAKQIIEEIKKEDARAAAEVPPSRRQTTAERLYDGDPQKVDQFTDDGELDPGFLQRVLTSVASSIDRVEQKQAKEHSTTL